MEPAVWLLSVEDSDSSILALTSCGLVHRHQRFGGNREKPLYPTSSRQNGVSVRLFLLRRCKQKLVRNTAANYKVSHS